MGFTDPIGQQLESREGKWHVVGVIKDFVAGMPYSPVWPIVVQGPGPHNWFGTMTFRLNPDHKTAENMEKISSVFAKYNPEQTFSYTFVDATFDSRFTYEKLIGKLAALFAGLAIFISCLGLFALAAYVIESRIKEIGVRKVLGASVVSITTLLSRDFLKLVLISFVIASSIAWWSMEQWLQHYPYRISISWWIFALTGLLSIMISTITVSFQSIKAALANPVNSLRTE
jgi:ABC-type antimicrobial peptide transport system permease subunit